MKLLPSKSLTISMVQPWKCDACGAWNRHTNDACRACAHTQPNRPWDSPSKKILIEAVNNLSAYAEASGFPGSSAMLKAVSLALLTDTDGHYGQVFRAMAQLHVRYLDGDYLTTRE